VACHVRLEKTKKDNNVPPGLPENRLHCPNADDFPAAAAQVATDCGSERLEGCRSVAPASNQPAERIRIRGGDQNDSGDRLIGTDSGGS
jgi:hypothetical protein